MTFSSVGSSTSYNPQVHHLHVVQEGETLDELASGHQASVADIARDNRGSKFQPGDLVTIPFKPSLRA
ncbi:MAG: LysM peptidoglycan-binding domain-containing protein [Candidatus Margulisiibacteriota bacterium]